MFFKPEVHKRKTSDYTRIIGVRNRGFSHLILRQVCRSVFPFARWLFDFYPRKKCAFRFPYFGKLNKGSIFCIGLEQLQNFHKFFWKLELDGIFANFIVVACDFSIFIDLFYLYFLIPKYLLYKMVFI